MKKLILLYFLMLGIVSTGQINPDGTVKQPPRETKTNPRNPTSTSGSIGIGIDLGGIIRSIKRNKNCNQVEVVFPPNKSKYITDKTNPPIFRWKSSKSDLVQFYKVELVRIDGKEKTILYQGETDQTQFSWPDEVSWRSEAAGKIKYEFYVMAVAKNADTCGNDVDGIEFSTTTENPVVADTNEDETPDGTTQKGGKALADTVKGDLTLGVGQSQKTDKIIAITPRNNASFKKEKLPDFTWRVDRIIENANFKIEISEVLPTGTTESIFIRENIKETRLSAKEVVSKLKDDAQYVWKVSETFTGISSNPSFFTTGSCDVDLQLTNETIECLGYEGDNRRYKICFSSTYQSTTGDLTFTNTGSGLFVYDQSNNPLSATLVSLQPQPGPTNTVNYCFEVLVNPGVTSIGFGLQGDDLDPTPITCQPGASLMINDLPNCLCDDCDSINLDYSNFTVSPQGTAGNQYNIAGNITANVPIYGMEIQIQTYSYTAAPAACSNGVTSIEESGMILLPSTSINNVTNLQLFNETQSGSSSTNNNASKTVKYLSTAPINGPIPINLTVGLPGPLPGFDATCCTINYRVCVKIKVFYDREGCKSCTFTKCIDFTNK
ncbi:MAG: hypothetical protein CVT96_06540 [Bacteroidetes bacterium HGW-Bacteroidetes-13]|nr:MAG: hypothetical protein CVT96_06540 [Bacteroidetes bacterium HGW-Bacteroidetes-13]